MRSALKAEPSSQDSSYQFYIEISTEVQLVVPHHKLSYSREDNGQLRKWNFDEQQEVLPQGKPWKPQTYFVYFKAYAVPPLGQKIRCIGKFHF